MFYDPGAYPFTAVFEQHWRRIYDEYQGVREHLWDWTETDRYHDGAWKVLMLFSLPNGDPIEENVRRCPFTAALMREHLPNRGVVTFSVLHPGTRIEPHKGHEGWQFLRGHLGLHVPAGDCALRVSGETRSWETGKVLVFDDQALHEAWNLTSEERVVLLFDFIPETKLS